MASKQDNVPLVPARGASTLPNVLVPLAGTRIIVIKRFDARTQLWVAWAMLLLATLVYMVVMSHQAVLRYDTFKATAFDLGNMDQVLWNTIHGRPFQFTNQAI